MIKIREKKEQAEGNIQMEAQKPAHISRDLFCDWQEGKLGTPEETDFFNNIGACTFCAGQFANWMEEGFLDEEGLALGQAPNGSLGKGTQLMEPPKYLKEEIISRIRQLDVQAAVKIKETSKQVQLMVYSLKVGLAVAASVFLLTVTADIQNMGFGQPQQPQAPTGNQQAVQEEQKGQGAEGNLISRLSQGSKDITGLLNEFSNGLFRIEMDSSEN